MTLIGRSRSGLAVVLVLGIVACVQDRMGELESDLRARIAESGAEVGLYYRNLTTGDSLLIHPDVRMHAASMMKVPVMVQVFRDADAGRLQLDQPLRVRNDFQSIVDGSSYALERASDSDTSLYDRVGHDLSVRELLDRMITRSSNLATNILINVADPKRTTATMRTFGADSIAVLRGVEDNKAYEAGLNNTTTARDLGVIFTAIAEHRAASPAACDTMLTVLAGQEFNSGIPAGLPPSARVAHKTGWISGINHDGGVVTLRDGTRYVLVVLTRGIEERVKADSLIADLSRMVYQQLKRR